MKINHVPVLLLAASVFTIVARAQQVVSYYAEIPSVAAGSPQILELPSFNSNLGQLTEVKLSFTGEIWQSIYGENMSATAGAYDFSTTAQLNLTKTDGPSLFFSPTFSLKRQGTAGAYDGSVDFADASGVRFDQNVVTNGVYFDPELTHYTGASPIDFKATLANTVLLNSDARFAKGSLLSSVVGLSVDYTFTPLAAIPEPAAGAAMMGAVVIAAGAVLRRRQTLAA